MSVCIVYSYFNYTHAHLLPHNNRVSVKIVNPNRKHALDSNRGKPGSLISPALANDLSEERNQVRLTLYNKQP